MALCYRMWRVSVSVRVWIQQQEALMDALIEQSCSVSIQTLCCVCKYVLSVFFSFHYLSARTQESAVEVEVGQLDEV